MWNGWRKLRRVLRTVWVEVRREDGDAASTVDTLDLADSRRIESEPARKVGEITGRSTDPAARKWWLAHQPIVRDGDSGAGRYYRAVEARSSPKGLAKKSDVARYTLVAIKNAMHELESQGVRPDGIILEPHEFKLLLETNFNWKKGDPLPSSVTLFGLPVKVQS